VGHTPYFGLDEAAEDVITTTSGQFLDPDALGDSAQNHYYQVLGIRADGQATISGRVGEFDFGLTPGD